MYQISKCSHSVDESESYKHMKVNKHVKLKIYHNTTVLAVPCLPLRGGGEGPLAVLSVLEVRFAPGKPPERASIIAY